MRWLLPGLVCAYALGILLADRSGLEVTVGLAFGPLGCVVGWLLGGRRGRSVAALGLGFAAGGVAFSARLDEARRFRPTAPQERTVEGRVSDARGDPGHLRVTLTRVRAVDGTRSAVPRRLQLRISEPLSVSLDVGVHVRARVRFDVPRPLRNPGGRDPTRDLARAGIGAVGRLVDPALIARMPERDLAGLVQLHATRRRLAARLARTGQGGALLRALALGDRTGLDPATREHFASLGIAHLLAVSGLHLGLLAGAAYGLARRLLARSAWLAARLDTRDAARVAAVAAACAYALLSGFGVPVRRALVLVVILVAAAWRQRRSPAFHPLALAAGVVLVIDPAALFSPGAQLSFAACAALLGFARRSPSRAVSRPERAVRALHASAVATAATAPLAAFHMGVAAPLALLVNSVAIPWTAFVLLPASLIAVALAALPENPLGAWVLFLAERLAAATLFFCDALGGQVPQRAGLAPHGGALAVAGGLALAALRARRASTASLLAGLCGVVLWLAPIPSQGPSVPRLALFDVGSGDAILVQGREASLLIDAGAAVPGRFDRGASTVVPALRALGVRGLDVLVATHADQDHRGGLPAVLRALPVGAVWIPFGSAPDPGFGALHAAASERGVPVVERAAGRPAVEIGDLRVEILWPPRALARAPRNERSLALRIEVASRRLLLLGDLGAAEARLLEAQPGLGADVLVLPHHGSQGSSSAALLAAVSPQIALLSAPCPPRRGLPHRAALARARHARVSLWWSGRDGAVLVGLDPLVVLPFAEARDCERVEPETLGLDVETQDLALIGVDAVVHPEGATADALQVR